MLEIERDLKKEDKVEDTDDPTDQPTAAPSDSTQSPTLGPTTSTPTEEDPERSLEPSASTKDPKESPEPSASKAQENSTQSDAPTMNTTQLDSIQVTSPKELVEVGLLPFSILIHGSISAEDEFEIRDELQDYLLASFLEEQVEVMADSVVLEMVQMVESYIPLLEADEDDNENRNRKRSLSNIRQREGYPLGRHLQAASSVSTASTLVEYQASSILSLDQQQQNDIIDNGLPTLEQRQIESLENTQDLQRHFLKLFALEQLEAGDIDAHAENSDLQEPVVLMEVQIAERPSKSLDSKETWEAIELIMDSSSTADSIDDLSDILDYYGVYENKSDIKDESRPSIWKIAVGAGCAFMILAGSVGVCFVRRKRKYHLDNKIGKETSSGEVIILQHVIERTNDTDGSDKHHESITAEQTNENRIISESKNIENPSVPKGNVDSEVKATTAEGRSSKKSSFTFSPFSFLRKSQKQENDEQHGDNDNDEAKSNLYDSHDDDSMMGYSLTSLSRDRIKGEGRHNDSHSVEDVSVASSKPDMRNSTFASIFSILQNNDESKSVSDGNGQLNEQNNQPQSLLGNDTMPSEQEESILTSDTFETGDGEGASDCDDAGSRKEGYMQSFISAFASEGITNDDSKHHAQDEFTMSQDNKPSVPSEEVQSASVLIHRRDIEPNPEVAMIQNNVSDDFSDAPSDERKNGRSTAMPSRYSADHARYPDAIRNSRVLDNDPAVLKYLVKDT
jgi:hypothetical protein